MVVMPSLWRTWARVADVWCLPCHIQKVKNLNRLFLVDQPTHEIKHIQAFYVNAKILWDIYMSHNGG